MLHSQCSPLSPIWWPFLVIPCCCFSKWLPETFHGRTMVSKTDSGDPSSGGYKMSMMAVYADCSQWRLLMRAALKNPCVKTPPRVQPWCSSLTQISVRDSLKIQHRHPSISPCCCSVLPMVVSKKNHGRIFQKSPLKKLAIYLPKGFSLLKKIL